MIKTLTICIALVGLPHFAAAQSVEDQVVTQLQAQGFRGIVVQRTLLGRLRFTAENPSFYRELVINPQTGVVLRDYVRDIEDDDDDVGNRDRTPRILNPNRSQSNADVNSDEDNDEDEKDDDKDDDDDDDDDDDEDD